MDIKNIYFNFKGRIGRQRFWLYYILPIMFMSGLLQASMDYYDDNSIVVFLLFAINILLMIAMAAGFVKRLHDRDKSAWWLILIFIPIIGTIYWIIDLGLFKGVNKINEYGSPDVPEDGVIDA